MKRSQITEQQTEIEVFIKVMKTEAFITVSM